MKKFLIGIFLFFGLGCFADQFVPNFNEMKTIRCDVEENIYNEDNSVVSKTNYFRIFKLDDPNQKIYLQKAPVDWLSYYGEDKIEFTLQPLADDYIMTSAVVIDRIIYTYYSNTKM